MRILRFLTQSGVTVAVVDGGSIVFYAPDMLFHYYVTAQEADRIFQHYLDGDQEYVVGPFAYSHGMVKFAMQGAKFESVVRSAELETGEAVF